MSRILLTVLALLIAGAVLLIRQRRQAGSNQPQPPHQAATAMSAKPTLEMVRRNHALEFQRLIDSVKTVADPPPSC
jgi:hypothetical protein